MRYLRFVLAALAIGAWAAGPLPGASAAALLAPSYVSSEPSKGATLHEPPSEVTVEFSEPLDESSWMKVLDECDQVISAGAATIQLTKMTVQIGEDTPSGMYEVVYKAVGLAGATGTSGSSFEFTVHGGKPCNGGGGGHHPPGHGKGKDKDKHKDHDRGNDDHRGGGHGGGGDHGSGGSTHSGHTGMTGMSGSTTHSGHTMPPAGDGHGSGNGHGNGHGKHGGGGTPPGGETPPLATGDTIPASADAEAVLVGLGLALAVGVVGGWLLRMSGNLSGA